MLRNALILLVSVCGLEARPAAQVRLGVNLGNHVVTASLGSRVHITGSPRRVFNTSHTARGHVHRASRPAPVLRPRVRSGYYKTVNTRVWTKGYYKTVYVPAEYGWSYDDCGHSVRVLLHAAYTRRVLVPGCWKYVTRRVWVGR